MDYFFAILFGGYCTYLVIRMIRSSSVIDLQISLLAIFAVGYYCLPIIFRELTPLSRFDDYSITVSLFMNVSYFVLFVLSCKFVYSQLSVQTTAPQADPIGRLISDNSLLIVAVCTAIYFYYVLTADLTSYSAANRDEFLVGDRGAASGLIASLAGLALATVATIGASWLSEGKFAQGAAAAVIVVMFSGLAVTLGQRLAVLSPLIVLLSAFGVYNLKRARSFILAGAIIALLVVSPVAVFLRSTQSVGGPSISSNLSSFTYGDDFVSKSFVSILDRADLLYNTIYLKKWIDGGNYANEQYYLSVVSLPVPRLIWQEKPYPLSTNGLYSGEISNAAWRLLHSGIGSLTAFGAITAYRQGGWLVMYVDAILLGALLALLARLLATGSVVDRIIYVSLFVALSVKRVPPSFMEALSELMPLLPIILFFRFANYVLSSTRSGIPRKP